MQWQELRSHIRHLPARDIARIGQAFELGKKMHEGQKRRSGEPYFNHPVAVSHMLLDLKADPDTIIAALLHDTVEDTELTLAEIDRDFDGSVAALIDGVTKLSSKDVAMSPKLDEQIETLRKIFTLMQQDVRIMVIKLVDRLHNMQTVEFLPPERQKLLAKETYEVFVKIADKLCMQDMRDELESLCLAVLEPEKHAALLELRNNNEQRGMVFMELIRTNLRAHDRILGSKIDLHFEAKTWDQMKAQLNVGGSVATGVSFLTVAFICEDTDACYRTLGALHQLWKREVLSFQDFINEPQLNGYRGLHTTIIAHDGTRVRCKIRTKDMHQYARQGVTTMCFTGTTEISEILPWSKRLTSLTNDTAGSSDDFWENLKSDILGESIIIHGPDDSTVRLPRNATALDGAFFLFHDRALKTTSIKLNGVDVPFSSPLSNAASLDVRLGETITCTREWLRQVETGFAAAKIRETLMKKSDVLKLKIGQEMLQQVLSERKRGFIQEFQEKKLGDQLASMGYDSLHDVYISIADGRLEPDDAYEALFRQKRIRKHDAPPPAMILRYAADMNSVETMDKLNMVHRTYGSQLKDIRYHRGDDGLVTVTLKANMHSQNLKVFREQLGMAGATALKSTMPWDPWSIIVTILLVFLWGMDAVLTKHLLDAGVSPGAFTLLRSWSGVGFAVVAVLAVWEPKTLLRIPVSHPLLWVSGIAFYFVNLITNYTLTDVSPFFYKTSLRISAVLLALPILFSKRQSMRSVLCLALAAGGLSLLFQNSPNEQGIFLAMCMVAMFVIYTKSSALFQESAHISVRYPQFFLAISAISALVSPIVYLFDSIVWPSPMLMFAVILFTAVFVCIPYMLFYHLHRMMGYAKLSPFFHLSIVVTFLAQWLLFGMFDGVLLIPCVAFILASALTPKTPTNSSNPV